MKFYNLIHDETQIEGFIDLVFPDLQGHEAIYVSLSARNKYLDEEARKVYQIGRSEMFNRQVVRNPKRFLNKIKEMSIYPQYSQKGEVFPIEPNLMTVYVNINPVDLTQAFHNASQVFYDRLLNKDMHIDTYSLFKTEIQKTRSRRNFIDLDLDVPFIPEEQRLWLVNNIKKQLTDVADVIPIQTISGAHFMLSNIIGDYTKIMSRVPYLLHDNKCYSEYEKFEFTKNNNFMVPLPGTYQGNYKVRVLPYA